MTFAFIKSWLTYQIALSRTITTEATLDFFIEHMSDQLQKAMWMFPQEDFTELDEQISEAFQDIRNRLKVLERARVFSGEENLHVCTHIHQRRGTGIFFNSVELIQCLQCKGWQSVRKVIL